MTTKTALLSTMFFLPGLAFAGGFPEGLRSRAEALGAPMTAVRRAYDASRSFPRKDAFALFDLSQPAKNKRLYVFDLKAGTVTAHYAAHGRGNGDNRRATRFRGFQSNHDMTPLGPLRTAASPTDMDHYRRIADRYDGRSYDGLTTLWLEGTTSYNRYINNATDGRSRVVWIIHPAWYVTEGYRKANPNALGRSLGCIALDPVVNNRVVARLKGGALFYVAVGNEPVEKYAR